MESTLKTNWFTRAAAFLEAGRVPNAKIYLAGLPLVFLSSIATHATEPSDKNLALYALANLLSLAMVVMAVFLLLPWLKSSSRNAIAVISIFGLFIGTLKGVTTAGFVVGLGLETSFETALTARFITPLIGLWFALAGAGIQAALTNFEDARRRLILRKIKLRDQDDRNAIPGLDDFLNKAQMLIPSSSADPRQISSLIFDLVQKQLRPLIYDLWRGESQKHPSFRLSDLYRRAIGTLPYSTLLASAIHGVTSIGSFDPSGATYWPIAALITFLTTAIVLALANALRGRLKGLRRAPLTTLIVTSLLASAALHLSLTIWGFDSWNPHWSIWLVSAWWVGSLVVIIGVVRAAVATNRENLEQLLELHGLGGGNEPEQLADYLQQRELANHLHSNLQNHLLAQAIRLEGTNDIDLRAELEQLRKTLEGAKNPAPPAESGMAEIAKRWQGIVKLDVQFSTTPTPEICEAIEEAISNAYRHGKAKHISVSLTAAELLVTDDGYGPTGGESGVGTHYFSTLGPWSLTPRQQGGAELRISL